MRSFVIFDERPCTPCMGTGVGSTNVLGYAGRCPECTGNQKLSHVQLPGGRWMPAMKWRTTEMGAIFYYVLMQHGVALTWDELRGASAFQRITFAETELIEISRDLAPILSAT